MLHKYCGCQLALFHALSMSEVMNDRGHDSEGVPFFFLFGLVFLLALPSAGLFTVQVGCMMDCLKLREVTVGSRACQAIPAADCNQGMLGSLLKSGCSLERQDALPPPCSLPQPLQRILSAAAVLGVGDL